MEWNDERIAALTRLWREGYSATQVAQQLGGVSRSAVIGKVHRLGIAGREAPSGLRGVSRAAGRQTDWLAVSDAKRLPRPESAGPNRPARRSRKDRADRELANQFVHRARLPLAPSANRARTASASCGSAFARGAAPIARATGQCRSVAGWRRSRPTRSTTWSAALATRRPGGRCDDVDLSRERARQRTDGPAEGGLRRPLGQPRAAPRRTRPAGDAARSSLCRSKRSRWRPDVPPTRAHRAAGASRGCSSDGSASARGRLVVAGGTVNRKTAPPEDAFLAEISPPWLSMMLRHSDSPTPIPLTLVVVNG